MWSADPTIRADTEADRIGFNSDLRDSDDKKEPGRSARAVQIFKSLESLILAQDERWRRASDMQVERESFLREASRVAHG